MGENAILELRTVNVGKDVTKFLKDWGIPYDPVRVVATTELAFQQVNEIIVGILRSAGFEPLGSYFQHPDGSRIEKIAAAKQDHKNADALLGSAEWCSDRYRGFGNPLTVTPVFKAMQDYIERAAGLETVLDRF